MTIVTAFRHVPPPVIGTVGVIIDHDFTRLEERLDWLETLGILVERFDPRTAPAEVARRPAVRALLTAESDLCLPLLLVNDAVVSRGVCPSRAQLARVVGRGRQMVRLADSRQLATIGAAAALGFEDVLRRQATRAREMGISRKAIRQAREAGASLHHAGAVEKR